MPRRYTKKGVLARAFMWGRGETPDRYRSHMGIIIILTRNKRVTDREHDLQIAYAGTCSPRVIIAWSGSPFVFSQEPNKFTCSANRVGISYYLNCGVERAL